VSTPPDAPDPRPGSPADGSGAPDVPDLPDAPRDGIAPGDLTPPSEAPSLGRRFASRRTLLSFVLAFALIAFFVSRLDPAVLAAAWAQIQQADWRLYALAILAYYAAFPIRAVRWRVLLRNSGEPPERVPSVRDASEMIYLSWFANSIVPAKLGDAYRGYLLRRAGGATWSHAMGTIVAERALDAIVLVVLMVGTGLLAYGDVLADAVQGGPAACLRRGIDPSNVSCSLLDLFVLGGVTALFLVVGLVVFARYGTHVERILPGRAADIYVRFSGALVLSFGRFRALLALSGLAWVAEGSAFWLVGRSLGYHLPLPLVVFFSLLQAFITVIPLTPGGLGLEPLLAAALSLRGYPPAAALAMTALYRTISYLSLVVGGFVVYLVSKKTK
jgi:glycosyltransferase 2 family protein